MRTSMTHPLQIATLSLGAGLGRIGITFCPGKVQADAMTGSWNRDLGRDLDAVRDWGAVAVVTLVEDHELEALQGENALILPIVDEQAVATVIGDWTGIPVGRMVKDELETVLNLEEHLATQQLE